MVWTDPVSQDLPALKGLAEHYGVRSVSVHAPCLLVTQRVWSPDPWQRLRKSAVLAERTGGADRGGAPAIRLAARLCPKLRLRVGPARRAVRRTVSFAVENMYPVRVAGRAVRAVRAGLGSDQDSGYRVLHAGPVALRRRPQRRAGDGRPNGRRPCTTCTWVTAPARDATSTWCPAGAPSPARRCCPRWPDVGSAVRWRWRCPPAGRESPADPAGRPAESLAFARHHLTAPSTVDA